MLFKMSDSRFVDTGFFNGLGSNEYTSWCSLVSENNDNLDEAKGTEAMEHALAEWEDADPRGAASDWALSRFCLRAAALATPAARQISARVFFGAGQRPVQHHWSPGPKTSASWNGKSLHEDVHVVSCLPRQLRSLRQNPSTSFQTRPRHREPKNPDPSRDALATAGPACPPMRGTSWPKWLRTGARTQLAHTQTHVRSNIVYGAVPNGMCFP